IFSAVKVGGKRSYEFARKNEDIELKSKLLVIDDIELTSYDLPYITLRVVCSKGTYIRALARDIGEALHSGAHLTGLTRTRVGEITVDKCLKMEEVDQFLEENIVVI
ncbi:MAG: tRNA pseudouridine(55) synthase, partial [Proteiniphilum sp.]